MQIGRPESKEYAEYFSTYIEKVPGSDILNYLEHQRASAVSLINQIDESKGDFRYEPGKWTLKELLGHIVDAERVFSYRALVFSRNDATPLPGFDQEPWARHANYNQISMREIAAEFDCLRRSTIFLFRHLDAAAWDRKGIANEKSMTTRAAAYVIAGHTEHHLGILKSRYL